jgi:DNA-binding SARP family transcriptional activator
VTDKLTLRLFGPPQIIVDEVPLKEPLLSKAQAILYYLAATGRPQSRTTLAGLLWGDMTEDTARTNLRKALADLRQALADFVLIDRQTVSLRTERRIQIDVVEFLDKIKLTAETVDFEALEEAIGLYQGDFLAGFYVRNAPDFESWLYTEQARLREMVVQALHLLSGHYAQLGDTTRGIGYVRQLLALEPWREEAHRHLMDLLAQAGQRGAALAQYEICRQVLAEELGVEPGALPRGAGPF